MATIKRNISIPTHIYDAIVRFAQDNHLNVTANWFSPVICSLFAEKLIREGYLPAISQGNPLCEDCNDATDENTETSSDVNFVSLSPCPLCGKLPIVQLIPNKDAPPLYFIRCSCGKIHTPTFYHEIDAITYWNNSVYQYNQHQYKAQYQTSSNLNESPSDNGGVQ